MNDIATKRFELMNHKLLLELERLEENQIKGRCEDCAFSHGTGDETKGWLICGVLWDSVDYPTKPTGYCHKWEKRI
jgi:hypothetical protein